MPHHTPLIATIVAGLTIAFGLGALAHRFRVSPLVGYLAAGVLVGPFTPGYVADQHLAQELAEIGVILLMFGVGLHFSLKDLLSVRRIAIPGAIGQMAVATALGMGLAHALGWTPMAGLVFGLALSVASTVVLLRALQERRIVQTERGRIAVGWLIVEDLAMVLALVLIPALAGALTASSASTDVVSGWIVPLATTIGKVIAFVAFMLIVGRRIIPWVLHWTAHTGSRELFRLAVFAIALGVAFGAALLFDVSFALGAFFAGMILAESELSQRAAEETLPLRDAFAVLFFVSVGMLFNPNVLVDQPWALAATVAIIVIGKSLAAWLIVRAFRHDNTTALTIAASLAQIGEFSFILATLGFELKLLPEAGRDLILGGAIVSILLNPLIFAAVLRTRPKAKPVAEVQTPAPANDPLPTALTEHVVVVGFGRVGAAVAEGLETAGRPFLVVEVDEKAGKRARDAGFEVIDGNAADPRVLAIAGVGVAHRLICTAPDGFEAGGVTEEARRVNPKLEIIARAHSDAEVDHLLKHGCDKPISGERELAAAMLAHLQPLAEPPPPLAVAAPAPTPQVLLNDAEWALLSVARLDGLAAGEAVPRDQLFEGARRIGDFDAEQLTNAVAGLAAKDLLASLDGERVALTPAGARQSAHAPVY
ncbi:YbaL family putative K(+) efflux transporter [Phenylobacterium sp.]|uniref:YbaL family putative K(+) efflux transporter n=1 Tax=Phenylobacterium sp. TaxID=1871053 RepID=UPI0025D2AF1B|nr:YbaL family putative K(+) efflux transporter [Phenylobacterium sp.]MBX3483342.1 Kef family K(+) transporter [Phenylobacterium sp.]MCW5758668.1 Kef family K(+) transporter [Phenylobacterium sp.]